MANIKISDLTAASAAADANEFEINEAGTSKKVTGSQIKAYVNSADGALASKNTVATADIDNLAVTTAKLAADAVDGTKIADDAINSEHYAAGSIDAEHIADSAVTAPKVAGANGTSGQVLQSDGDGTMSFVTLAAGGGFSNLQAFTSPGTWTNPGNVEKVKVTVVGGGGGGGGSGPSPNNNPGYAGGGGGGGAAIEVISFPTGTNVPVTVGGGGTGPANAAGNAGGTSSFGAYCSATGGSGGSRHDDNNLNTVYPEPGAAGGAGSGGNINLRGGNGERTNTPMWGQGQWHYSAGQAGDSALGFGYGGHNVKRGYNAPAGANGLPGQGYGGGGGGALKRDPAPNMSGGNGTGGIVIVEY